MYFWIFLDSFRWPQNDPKMTPKMKNFAQVFSIFYVLKCSFCQFLDRYRRLKMLKTFNEARTLCPIGVYEEIIAVLQMKKISNWHRKWFPILNVFMHFLSNFRWTSWIRWLKTLNMRFQSFFSFFKVYMLIFDRLRGLECWKESERKVFVVQ